MFFHAPGSKQLCWSVLDPTWVPVHVLLLTDSGPGSLNEARPFVNHIHRTVRSRMILQGPRVLEQHTRCIVHFRAGSALAAIRLQVTVRQ